MTNLNMNITDNDKNSRNTIDLSSINDGIELVENEKKVEIPQDIANISKKITSEQLPERNREILSEEVVKVKKCYQDYQNVLSKLPENYLESLNTSYMSLERCIAAVPKDILLKFAKSFETIDDDLPGIFLNPNDYGHSNYSFIVEKLKVYYDFFTMVPYQMISNLFEAYQNYSRLYKAAPKNVFDSLITAYSNYKEAYNRVSSEDIEKYKCVNLTSSFIDKFLLYEENMNYILNERDIDNLISDERYFVSNDVSTKSRRCVIVPILTKEEFIRVAVREGNIEKANELCFENIRKIYDSLYDVGVYLDSENAYLNNLKNNMQASSMFIALEQDKKDNIFRIVNDQISIREYVLDKISNDLKHGWNQLDGDVGSGFDLDFDDSDYFTKYTVVSECATKYKESFDSIISMEEIINTINANGYNIK